MFSSLILTGVILLGVLTTFWVSQLLSKTVLKGIPSSFTLELPPYRKPRVGQVIVRSIFDRTLFVLGRAVLIAAPAGLLIWVMANVQIGDVTILKQVSNFLDPFAHLMGLDGIILLAFILGFPANEIVIPIMIMGYMASSTLVDYTSLESFKELLVANNWTWLTAVNTILFSLYHWPCSTTLLTIYKETKSKKWTALSFLVPTVIGIGVTMLTTLIVHLFNSL
nr:nucleoside recognition domain-containing protein [Enterococcus rivorum]